MLLCMVCFTENLWVISWCQSQHKIFSCLSNATDKSIPLLGLTTESSFYTGTGTEFCDMIEGKRLVWMFESWLFVWVISPLALQEKRMPRGRGLRKPSFRVVLVPFPASATWGGFLVLPHIRTSPLWHSRVMPTIRIQTTKGFGTKFLPSLTLSQHSFKVI